MLPQLRPSQSFLKPILNKNLTPIETFVKSLLEYLIENQTFLKPLLKFLVAIQSQLVAVYLNKIVAKMEINLICKKSTKNGSICNRKKGSIKQLLKSGKISKTALSSFNINHLSLSDLFTIFIYHLYIHHNQWSEII